MLVKLNYHIIRSRDKYTYMASLQSVDGIDIERGIPIPIELPVKVYDEVCSVSFKGYNHRDITMRHEILINLLYLTIKDVWDWTCGVPVITIKGQTSLFPSEYTQTHIVPYFLNSDSPITVLDQYLQWIHSIRFLPIMTLLYCHDRYTFTTIQNHMQMEPFMKAILKNHL